MQFPILLKTGSIRYHLICQLWCADRQKEQFRISPRNNPDKYFLIQNNRPILRAKGLKHRRIDWKLVEGKLTNKTIFDQITGLIETALKPHSSDKALFDLDPDLGSTKNSYNRKKPGSDLRSLGARQDPSK